MTAQQHTHTHQPGHQHDHSHSQSHDHTHSHSHSHEDIDWEAMADHLEREAEIGLPFLDEAAAWLRGLLRDSVAVTRVLDVGSGPGVATSQLALAFPEAEAVAVDGAPKLLERARARADALGVGDRVTTRKAELPDDLGSLGEADLVWTGHVVHHLGDQQEALREMGRLLRPGGVLAVVESGLNARFLPRDIGMGRPGLLARVEATREDWFVRMRTALPGHKATVEHWPGLLAAAGLTPSGTRSFLTDIPAPVDAPVRAHLHAQLTRMRDVLTDELAADDLTVLDRLLDDDSPEGILNRPDAFYLTATTVHTARRTA
ncbi:class I SAM-dependent methyltransferase [Streptomyces daliensis]